MRHVQASQAWALQGARCTGLSALGPQLPDLAQLHEDVDDAQEVGGRQRGAGVAAGHVVLVQAPLALAQPAPAHTGFIRYQATMHM